MTGIYRLYHGSEFEIKVPVYGKGKSYNDYGLGFYTTRNKGLAGEWAVLMTQKDGYINEYAFNDGSIFNDDGLEIEPELKTLNLDNMDIKHWVAVLMDNREGDYEDPAIYDIIKEFKDNYLIDVSEYDVITGWRADDSYFRFVEDFVLNRLSLENLQKAMRFGNLGYQICLKSEKTFSPGRLKFITSYRAEMSRFFSFAEERDKEARRSYAKMIQDSGARNGTLITALLA